MMVRNVIYFLVSCFIACCLQAQTNETAEARATRWLTNRLASASWQVLIDKWDVSKAAMTSPMENLILPVDHYPNGRKRIVLIARRAQILSETLVYAEDVKLEMLTPEGKSDGIVLAEDCLLDQVTKRGYCRGNVRVTRGADEIQGKGLMFAGEEQFIKILADCEIRTFHVPVKLGSLS